MAFVARMLACISFVFMKNIPNSSHNNSSHNSLNISQRVESVFTPVSTSRLLSLRFSLPLLVPPLSLIVYYIHSTFHRIRHKLDSVCPAQQSLVGTSQTRHHTHTPHFSCTHTHDHAPRLNFTKSDRGQAQHVKTTPQRTRFRDVQQEIIMATV